MLSLYLAPQITVTAAVTWQLYQRSGRTWIRTSFNLIQHHDKLSLILLARLLTTFCRHDNLEWLKMMFIQLTIWFVHCALATSFGSWQFVQRLASVDGASSGGFSRGLQRVLMFVSERQRRSSNKMQDYLVLFSLFKFQGRKIIVSRPFFMAALVNVYLPQHEIVIYMASRNLPVK